jgi:hypothetical protein
VHLKGVLKSGTVGNAVFQLPNGYRPALQNEFVVSGYSDDYGTVIITSSGNVEIYHLSNNTKFSISNITFKAGA